MVFRRNKKGTSSRRRRALKREVYLVPILLFLVIYQYSQITTTTSSDIISRPEIINSNKSPRPPIPLAKSSSSSSLPQIVLKDSNGKIISRKSKSLSQYYNYDDIGNDEKGNNNNVTNNNKNNNKNKNNVQTNDGNDGDRKYIINLLKDAEITDINLSEIKLLPTSQQINDLYYNNGPKSNNNNNGQPIILGLDTCQTFRNQVPIIDDRFIGVSGMFNSGTTAFGMLLQANCKFNKKHHNHHKYNYTNNNVMTDVNGMLNQVPWAKHKNARERLKHTINNEINKDHVLPIVLIRDPYYWMQSMCKQGYGARWDHDEIKHCPNLVPNSFDKKRFKKRLRKNSTSVMVWMGKNRHEGPNWDSLVHLWNDWYNSYFNITTFPRLMIRFEDTLFHGKQVLQKVCECAGAEFVPSSSNKQKFKYVVDEAKFNHVNSKQNNMISAIIKYGTDKTRYDNMTIDDLRYAYEMLDKKLMETFQYKVYKK